MSIKDTLKKNEKIRLFGVMLKMRNNAEFREKVFTAYDQPDVLFFKHPGNLNPDKNVYMIYNNSSTRGFFSLFNLVLDGLQFADYYHLIPVVEFGPDTLYHEADGLHGTLNSFEYYFKQPGGIAVKEARKSRNVVLFERSHRKLSIPDFDFTLGASLQDDAKMEKYLAEKGEIIRKYISFSDTTEEYLQKSLTDLRIDGRILGVHVRGTDMKTGYNGHVKFITPEEYLAEAQKVFQTGKYNKVFLATDESAVINLFQKAFGDDLLYYTDILRSDDGEALHFSTSQRKNHKYLLGLEVLRDMYTLSVADGLIAGLSNVSITARMMKKSYGKEYDALKIINHGVNKSNISMEKTKKRREK